MIPQNFTNKSQQAIQEAQEIANENGHPQVEPPHLFLALLEQEEGVVLSVLRKLNINVMELNNEVQEMINIIPKQGVAALRNLGQVLLGQAMMYILQAADQTAKKNKDK